MINNGVLLKRRIDKYLEDWKDGPNKLPLIVNGARQIGKTTSIRHFGKTHYKSFVEVNFASQDAYLNIFNDGYSPREVIKNISMININAKFLPGETLIFFDELQSCPKAITCLKPFAIDGKYDVICSGTLMPIQYESIFGTSGGYKEDYQMYGLDFEEFLWAMGYRDSQIEDLYTSMLELKPVTSTTHLIMNKLFLDFTITGGFPKIINDYVVNKMFGNLFLEQRKIKEQIEDNLKQHVIGLDKTKVLEVFNSDSKQLEKENKKFQFNKLSKKRSDNYIGCIEWLMDSDIVLKSKSLSSLDLPFGGNSRNGIFKLYYSDTGVLISSFNNETQQQMRSNKNLGVYNGAVYENLIALSLTMQGYGLYYYKRDNSSLTIDFLARNMNYIIPVEVHSTSLNSKALRTIIESDRYPLVKFGIRFGNHNIGYSNKILSFPYYLSFLLRRFLENADRFEHESTI